MSLFQRSLYSPDQTFTNLFRLLDDFDSYSRETQANAANNGSPTAVTAPGGPGNRQLAGGRHHHGGRLFSPRFDVRETETSYELHGELAGLDKKDVAIEFTDPQTLVVSGRVERNYESGEPEAAEKPAEKPAEGEAAASSQTAPTHKATVTDEATEAAKESGAVAPAAKKEVANKPIERYWYQERSVGEFHRTFSFPAPVDEENVKATLDNGILTVSVPKTTKRETRRIAVN